MASFTSEIKREITNLPLNSECCNFAELLGVVCFGGIIKDNVLSIRTETAFCAKRIAELIRCVFGRKTEYILKGEKSRYYVVEIADNETIMDTLNMFALVKSSHDFKNFVSFQVNERFIKNDCCKRAFARGAFLCSGSCISPEKSYHLEISSNRRKVVKTLSDILMYYQINSKTIQRGSNYVIYLKESEKIFDFLGVIGATNNMLEFQQTKIYKNFINNITRVTNCENANMDKTINTGTMQGMAIEKIKNTIGLESLEPSLREVAYLRLENKGISLKQLGEMLKVPLSKSGVNHKLKKLEKIAESLK